jgi:Zn-dependent peptidase ImmA (M78 family)
MQQVLVDVAAQLRERANQTEPAFSTQQIVAVCFPDALVTGHPLPLDIDEAVSRTSDGIVILYRRGLSTGEQRLAIAHAIAHLLFDGPESACRPGCCGVLENEQRADAFAAELLVPLSGLAEYVTYLPGECEEGIYLDQVDQIASHFQVPSALIDSRIRQLRC